MSLVVVGCNYRSTPLDLLERLTVSPQDLPKTLHETATAPNLSEAVVLSTCSRIEVYAYAERFHGGYADIREVLACHSGLPPEEVADQLYAYHDVEAVTHLFSVAAGLDSVVLGEHEILGQVRSAWQAGRAEGTVGSVLDLLFRHALTTGKRARTKTGISRSTASLSHAAVELATAHLGGLKGSNVLVLGAGEMASGTLRSLAREAPADLVVASRTTRRAADVAASCGGRAVSLQDLEEALSRADALFATTGASDIVVEHADISSVMTRRKGTALLIVDIAVPRDVDPAVAQLPGVTLLNIEDIGAFVEQGRVARNHAVSEVQAIVEQEVERYRASVSAREVAPLITALRSRAHHITTAELAHHEAQFDELSDAQRSAVESLLNRTINKLLHEPTVKLKSSAGHARGDRLGEALRDLFSL